MDKKNSEERRLPSCRHRKNIRKDVWKFTSIGFMQKNSHKKVTYLFGFPSIHCCSRYQKKGFEVGMELVANVTNGIWCVEYFWT